MICFCPADTRLLGQDQKGRKGRGVAETVVDVRRVLSQYTMRTIGPDILCGLKWEPKTEGKVKVHIEHKYVHDDHELQRHQAVRARKHVRNKGTTETEKDVC